MESERPEQEPEAASNGRASSVVEEEGIDESFSERLGWNYPVRSIKAPEPGGNTPKRQRQEDGEAPTQGTSLEDFHWATNWAPLDLAAFK